MTPARPVVIVVDDDDSLRNAMDRLLDAAGFQPEVHESAESLQATGSRADAACVVTDLELPGMTGLELVEKLKAQGASVPVVLITAHDAPGMAEFVRQRGAAAYIAKPFRGTVLLQTIRTVLGRSPVG